MNIVRSFETAFKRMKEKGWDKIYILVDIHDTVFEATYSKDEYYRWFPYAKEALHLMSINPRISLILWSSSYTDAIEKYINTFEKSKIHFDMVNVNKETEDNELSCFAQKTYFNIGIDDKFGFDARVDWEMIYHYLDDSMKIGRI